MDAAPLVAGLRSRGVALSVVDGQLRYRAPHGVLTADLRDALRMNRAEIVDQLNKESAGPPWRRLPIPERLADAGPCPDCRGPMEPTGYVFPYGRAWYCHDRERCGRVIYART